MTRWLCYVNLFIPLLHIILIVTHIHLSLCSFRLIRYLHDKGIVIVSLHCATLKWKSWPPLLPMSQFSHFRSLIKFSPLIRSATRPVDFNYYISVNKKSPHLYLCIDSSWLPSFPTPQSTHITTPRYQFILVFVSASSLLRHSFIEQQERQFIKL